MGGGGGGSVCLKAIDSPPHSPGPQNYNNNKKKQKNNEVALTAPHTPNVRINCGGREDKGFDDECGVDHMQHMQVSQRRN